MQTCSRCHAQSADTALICSNCGADLHEVSVSVQTLKRLQNNPRVTSVRVVVARDACLSCQDHAGVYAKDKVPVLPVAGCSHDNGCRCFYEPILNEIYP